MARASIGLKNEVSKIVSSTEVRFRCWESPFIMVKTPRSEGDDYWVKGQGPYWPSWEGCWCQVVTFDHLLKMVFISKIRYVRKDMFFWFLRPEGFLSQLRFFRPFFQGPLVFSVSLRLRAGDGKFPQTGAGKSPSPWGKHLLVRRVRRFFWKRALESSIAKKKLTPPKLQNLPGPTPDAFDKNTTARLRNARPERASLGAVSLACPLGLNKPSAYWRLFG